MDANSTQVAGTHYASEYQHWDFVLNGLGGRYFEGQVTKYVFRWRKKNGIQDLEKALHFLAKMRQEFINGACIPLSVVWEITGEGGDVPRQALLFCAKNNLGYSEQRVMELMATWRKVEDLDAIRDHIRALILAEKSLKGDP